MNFGNGSTTTDAFVVTTTPSATESAAATNRVLNQLAPCFLN